MKHPGSCFLPHFYGEEETADNAVVFCTLIDVLFLQFVSFLGGVCLLCASLHHILVRHQAQSHPNHLSVTGVHVETDSNKLYPRGVCCICRLPLMFRSKLIIVTIEQCDLIMLSLSISV